MKRLLTAVLATLTLVLGVAATAAPAGAYPAVAFAAQCKGDSTITVKPRAIQTLTVSGTNINVGDGAILTVNGNGNCVNGGSRDMLTVNGNNNYVSAQQGVVSLAGANSFFASNGRNVVNCGGNLSTLLRTDVATACRQ